MEKNQVKINPFKLLAKMFLEEDDDIEKEWEEEPNHKVLEEALAKVDKMQPRIEPVVTSKKTKNRKISEFTQNDLIVKKETQMKEVPINHNNKNRIVEERDHE